MLKAVSALKNSIDETTVLLSSEQLKNMLNSKKCLCCNRTFEEGDISDTYIKQLLKLQEKAGNQREISDISNGIENARNNYDSNITKISDYLNKVAGAKSSIEDCKKEISDYDKQISDSSMKESELASLKSAYDNFVSKQSNINNQIVILNNSIDELGNSLKEKQ